MENRVLDFFRRSIFKPNRSIIIIFVAFLLLILWQRHLTFMDEADNILGALAVADGKDVYNGFISQHTPFVYYYFSLFALIGVSDYETFRLCMAFTLLAIWLIIFFRYKKYFGTTVFLIVFLLYPLTANLHWGHMILSDVFQGFSLFVLLLEFIIYWKNKQIEVRNVIFISASIFISMMSAFISVYPIFIIFLGFVTHELLHNKTFKDYANKIKSYLMIIGITSVPFSILFLWYAITGNFKNFYFQAYTFNRVYFSKYLEGFGSNTLSVFKDTFVNWIRFMTVSLTQFKGDTLITTLLVIFIILFIVNMFKENKVLAVIVFVFITFTGVRGYTNFHATTYYIVAFFAAGYVIDNYVFSKNNVNQFKKIAIQIMTFLLFLISFNNYIPFVGDNLLSQKGTITSGPLDRYIQTLTDPKDTIWISYDDPIAYIKNHREPGSSVYILFPWFSEVFSDEVINDLKKNKTKLVTYDPESDIWGRKYKDFATEVYSFIQQNYTALNQDDPVEKNIYILNEYYDEALSKLWVDIDKFGLKNGMLVTDASSKVYLIESDTKRYITNPDVFAKRKFKGEDIKKIEDGILPRIRTGKQIDQ